LGRRRYLKGVDMALEFATGDLVWGSGDAATTVYTVSGLSFQPKALMFVTTGITAVGGSSSIDHARHNYGFAVSTSSRRCVGLQNVHNSGSCDCQEFFRDDAVVTVIDAAAAVDGLLDLNSITSDGFTLIVDNQVATDIAVVWYAWGGEDIVTAAIGDIVEPAATGVQSYTVTGWIDPATLASDSAVLFAGCQLTAAAPTGAAVDAGLMLGVATGTGSGNQWVVAVNDDEGSGTMDTDRYHRGDECIAMMALAGGNPSARAQFNGFDSAGFDLSWVARATTNRRYIYMALQGGGWKAGSYNFDTGSIGNTATVSALAFNPAGAIHATTTSVEDAAGASRTTAHYAIGGWSSISSRRNNFYGSTNGSPNSGIFIGDDNDNILQSFGGSIGATIDIDAVLADGFRVIVDDGPTALTDFQSYLAFGNDPGYPNNPSFLQISRLRR
jgi:hypothetical protein